MFGEMAKWVTTVEDAAAVPELVSHAFHTATSGRPGPVVIALPEDAQADEADVADAAPYHPAQASAARRGRRPRARPPRRAPSGRCSSSAAAGGASGQAATCVAFAEASNVPVVASFRRQDYVDNASPAYAGPLTIGMDPALAQRVRGRRRDPRARHAARRDRHAAVLAPRAAAAAADADPRPRRPRRARPRVRGGAADRLRLAAVRGDAPPGRTAPREPGGSSPRAPTTWPTFGTTRCRATSSSAT